jgi:hypothetical protein
MRTTVGLGAIVLSTVILHALPAAADEKGGFEAAAMAGYGVSNEPNVIGPSVGLRLGYETRSMLYLGAIGTVHFGSTDDDEPDVRHYSQSLRGELGIGIVIPFFELRPSLRAGYSRVTTPRDTNGSFWSPELGLGATLLLRLEGPFLGVDAEASYFTRLVENGDAQFALTSIAAYAVAGYRF